MFDEAQRVIETFDSLAYIVARWALHVHLIEAAPGYDVSHSEPQWPTRIFVSIPDRHDAIGSMRLAESVIHEALHLQLTAVEAHTPLVAMPGNHLSSPWREELRPVGGVLHGLYVFSCLSAFFANFAASSEGAMRAHTLQRANEISDEISSIDLDRLLAGLTPDGADLVRAIWARYHT